MPKEKVLVSLAAIATVVAGALHLYLVREHWSDYWAYGLFFVLIGVVQVAGGLALLAAPRRSLYLIGVVGTVALLAFYVWTRTVAVPIGPMSGEPEAVGGIDIVTNALEVLSVVALATALWFRQGQPVERKQAQAAHR